MLNRWQRKMLSLARVPINLFMGNNIDISCIRIMLTHKTPLCIPQIIQVIGTQRLALTLLMHTSVTLAKKHKEIMLMRHEQLRIS